MQVKSDASGSGVYSPDPFFQNTDLTDVLPSILKGQEALKSYLVLIEMLPTVNSMNAPTFMSDFLKAKELASRFYSNANYRFETAHRDRKMQHAIAKFDRAPDFLRARGIKYSDAAGGAYADMDLEYIKASEQEAYWMSLREYFNNLVFSFQSAYDATRRIYDQTKDPRGSATALSSGPNGQ